MTEKRRLFSSTPRKKLFSTANEENSVKAVRCMDCGYILETAASTSRIYCPKCGGTRFNVYRIPESPELTPEPVKVEEEKSFSRKSLFGNDEFQKEFTEPTTVFEEKLKEFSGKVINIDECEKIFSCTPEELLEKNYAELNNDGNLIISDSAFLIDKLFSKLIITVTRELDLPEITQPKECVIDSLAEKGNLSPKGVVMIKKAHMLSPVSNSSVECPETDLKGWINDSGIIGDTKIELGDKDNLKLDDFMDYLKSRYPDAPKGLLEHLISSGLVKIDGSKVNIIK